MLPFLTPGGLRLVAHSMNTRPAAQTPFPNLNPLAELLTSPHKAVLDLLKQAQDQENRDADGDPDTEVACPGTYTYYRADTHDEGKANLIDLPRNSGFLSLKHD
jgi:hypothetical protein